MRLCVRIAQLGIQYKITEHDEQAGNGPSRRHIQGSKIAKGLQNFQVLVNWDYFNGKISL